MREREREKFFGEITLAENSHRFSPLVTTEIRFCLRFCSSAAGAGAAAHRCKFHEKTNVFIIPSIHVANY
jgi:hypothetical protein